MHNFIAYFRKWGDFLKSYWAKWPRKQLAFFLTGRMQCVVLRGTCSSWSPVLSGVPQGTILGPVLFILYVNDISSGISSTVKLYADDTKVYREISDIARDTSILQSDLFQLRNWSEVGQLNFNAKKCEIMPVTHNRDKSVPRPAWRTSKLSEFCKGPRHHNLAWPLVVFTRCWGCQ